MNDALAGKPARSSHEERQVQLMAFWTGVLDRLKSYIEGRDDQLDRPTGAPIFGPPPDPDTDARRCE